MARKLPTIPAGAILHAIVTLQGLTNNQVDDLIREVTGLLDGTGSITRISSRLKMIMSEMAAHPGRCLVMGALYGGAFGFLRKINPKKSVTIPGICRIGL